MLVTGASGFLGRHLVRGPATEGWELIAPTSRAMDITDRANTIDTITGWKPSVVVHLAYRKGDRRVIVEGSRHVAEAATECGARLVHMSTDAVFGGRAAPYTEADTPDPAIQYGIDKYDAEQVVASIDPTAAIVRTSLLYGTDRLSDFQVELAEDLRRGRSPMTFFNDEFRCPAHADDIAAALATLAAQANRCGVLHVAGPERLSRVEIAQACAHFAGFPDARLPETTIAESGLARLGNVILDSSLATQQGVLCRTVGETLGR
ncbi:MAG: dTDP-4-dehydrorhamnose reductase [Ilumatobacter sp.]|jgi:dTDP-4-dehydrorhamnose reductase